MLDRIATVRQKRYAFTCDMVTRGGGMIAAPLPRMAGQPQMVVGIGGISEVMRQRESTLATAIRTQIKQRFGSEYGDLGRIEDENLDPLARAYRHLRAKMQSVA